MLFQKHYQFQHLHAHQTLIILNSLKDNLMNNKYRDLAYLVDQDLDLILIECNQCRNKTLWQLNIEIRHNSQHKECRKELLLQQH
jgi:hypothetical protein